MANPCESAGQRQGWVGPRHAWPTRAAQPHATLHVIPEQETTEGAETWSARVRTDCVRRSERVGTPSSCAAARSSRGCSVTTLAAADAVEGNAKASSARPGAPKLRSASRRTSARRVSGSRPGRRTTTPDERQAAICAAVSGSESSVAPAGADATRLLGSHRMRRSGFGPTCADTCTS